LILLGILDYDLWLKNDCSPGNREGASNKCVNALVRAPIFCAKSFTKRGWIAG